MADQDAGILWGYPAIGEFLGRKRRWVESQVERGTAVARAIRKVPGIREPFAKKEELLSALIEGSESIRASSE